MITRYLNDFIFAGFLTSGSCSLQALTSSFVECLETVVGSFIFVALQLTKKPKKNIRLAK